MGFGELHFDQPDGTSPWRFQSAVDAARAIRDRQEQFALAARRTAASALAGVTSGAAATKS
jgi:hypothetical protein